MGRLTKLEIQHALLSGREIFWTNVAGKLETIELKELAQRRLFEFLLQSTVREAKGLSPQFVEGLSSAFNGKNDPAEGRTSTSAVSLAKTWRLKKIETSGFGGLNTWGGPVFKLDLEAESLILQGPNGSGKSSLIGAVIWAMTGERPRDHSDTNAEERAEVYDENNQKIGTWPPIACYPTSPTNLVSNPYVQVALTFMDESGATAVLERKLAEGVTSTHADPALNLPDVLVETGLLMPSRMSQIRFEKGQTPLTKAVQSLTGLDDLVDIGALADGLCHRGREYLSGPSKGLEQKKALFDAALAEAQRALAPTGETLQAFVPKDTEDDKGAFVAFGRRLRDRATELTQVISQDLAAGLNLSNGGTQAEVSGAITSTREDLSGGLGDLTTWKSLSMISTTLDDKAITALQTALDEAEHALAEALQLEARSQQDNRLQLKALGAHWHETHRGGDLINCPLCDELLEDAVLRTDIETLRRVGAAATRRLADNLNAISSRLDLAVPAALRSQLDNLGLLAPRRSLIADITARYINRPRFQSFLTSFARLVINGLNHVPPDELEPSDSVVRDRDPVEVLRGRIVSARRLLQLQIWCLQNLTAWEKWWSVVAGIAPKDVDKEHLTAGQSHHETFADHLTRLSNAVGEAEPYRAAADALARAWRLGGEARSLEKIKEEREAIAEQLAPLKSLGALAESQARLAIETLSDDISAILKRIHLSERLSFKGAKLQRKTGLEVHAAFADDFKIDATLVANSSWLRAVLWAFLFALREEAIKQFGAEPLALLLLDDPQVTFDSEHRHRWASEVIGLQTRQTPTQVIIATHDEVFVELLKVDGVKGREAIIVSAGTELGHAGIFEGASLDRAWEKTRGQNTAEAGQDYIGDVRVYVEGLLRLMLRGHAADVNWVTNGFVVGDAREKIRELHEAKIAPWDKSEFKSLAGQLDNGTLAIRHMEMAHHSGRRHLAMAEANGVETHWRKKLQPALRRAFQLARDHQVLHGGMRALHAAEPVSELPEGYTSTVKSLRFPMLGRAAALTGGITADGRVDLDFSSNQTNPIVLGRHFAFRLNAPTLEPVARKGDILIVKEIGEPSPRSLVVARYEERVVARRFEIADNHSDIAVLTANAVNPREIAPPIVAKKTTLELHKIVGVLFEHGPTASTGEGEVLDCGGESSIRRYVSEVKGLVEVLGNSAEPIALNGQMLLIGDAVAAEKALHRLDGRPVIAGDMADVRYFKRLRRAENNTVVLESLEISGDFPPVVLTYATNSTTDLKEVWPVLGVLFERP